MSDLGENDLGEYVFTRSFDAVDWAKAFVATVTNKPEIATDVETMTTWFANAIMRGYDEHARRSSKGMNVG